MVKPRWLVVGVVGAWSLACTISGHPSGRYEIVSFTVIPAQGPPRTVADAGFLQLGDVLVCDSGVVCSDDGLDETGVSVLSYHWVGSGFVPVWAPERVTFRTPPWNPDTDSWDEPLPLGNVTCVLTRVERNPLVLVGEGCDADGQVVAVELTMDR